MRFFYKVFNMKQKKKNMNYFHSEYYVKNKLNCKNDIDMLSICIIFSIFINTFIKNFMETLRRYFEHIFQFLNIYCKKTY